MLSKKPKIPIYVQAILNIVALVVFLTFTRPAEDNFSLSFVPLILLGMTVYSVLLSLARYVFRISLSRTTRVLSATFAATSVLLVMFSALGQLESFDVFLLISLVGLGVFYFSRTWPK